MLRELGETTVDRSATGGWAGISMTAKLTVIMYILISFEVGILLLILPWSVQFWEENFFLYVLSERLGAPWLPEVVASGWVRGAVAGLGLFNVILGIRETFHFRQRVGEIATRSKISAASKREAGSDVTSSS
jgi:hypothetical protein